MLVGVLRREGLGEAVLLAHSYGTAVASRLLQRPRNYNTAGGGALVVRGLALVDPVVFGESSCWLGSCGCATCSSLECMCTYACVHVTAHACSMPATPGQHATHLLLILLPPTTRRNAGMFMPSLLRSFIYDAPASGSLLGDFMMRYAARDLHVSATLSRRFFW